MNALIEAAHLPGAGLDARKMPGHWLLARLGKRVLRPGGLELTRRMLEALSIRPCDAVVEFAPGLGVTARLALACRPATYTAIERDEQAVLNLRRWLKGAQQQCRLGLADETGLPDGAATVVYGEAMLTMQGQAQKTAIVDEAFRLLRPGGRYGLHELCLLPEDLDEGIKTEIQDQLTETIRVGARPLTSSEWRKLVESAGFKVQQADTAPMHLLEPIRLLRDEGFLGASRFLWNVLRDGEARERVLAMRRLFRKCESHLAAIMLVAGKPPVATTANH